MAYVPLRGQFFIIGAIVLFLMWGALRCPHSYRPPDGAP